MKTYISLLRGINVSGQNRISMAGLKGVYESIGLANVATYIQSGNVVFDCPEQDPGSLARSIESEIARSLAASVQVLLRDKARFQRILNNNPFLEQRGADPEKLHVTFLSESPSEAALRTLPLPADEVDEFMVYDTEIYLHTPNGYGRTRLSNNFFERKLGVTATTRNWKTVKTLYEMAGQR